MKKHYDFSNGEKGKFYIPEDQIELPIYLDQENQKYYSNLAADKSMALSNLINSILSQDKLITKFNLSD